MKNNQLNNPLKKIEDQIDNIFFPLDENLEDVKPIFKAENIALNSLTNMKKHLIQLVKEMKNNKMHLVA